MPYKGVVHLDINPRNVLFWFEAHGRHGGIVLADFGFSRYGATDDFVRLPRSEPWDPPEWNEREFTLEAAKKTDIYAFGLICFWLFFRYDTLADLGFPDMTVQEAFVCGCHDVITAIQAKKKSKVAILEWALDLLAAKKGLNDVVQSRMKELFTLTLVRDPAKRAASMESLAAIWLDESYNPVSEGASRTETTASEALGDGEQLNPSSPGSDLLTSSLVRAPEWHGTLEVSPTHPLFIVLSRT